jgi:hypothetical protein
MTVRETLCFEGRGDSFGIEDHLKISDWAKQNDHRAAVCLDHGIEGEDYEEAILFLFGASDRCRFIMWRSLHAVFVQPLIGRGKRYGSVGEALEGSLLNNVLSEPRRARAPRYADA